VHTAPVIICEFDLAYSLSGSGCTGRAIGAPLSRVGVARFPIRFTGANRAMCVLGLTTRSSYVEVTSTQLMVRMGWAFRATGALASVRSVGDDHGRVWGWGAHGWRGVWLVNGSSTGIVRVALDPAGRAATLGFPVRLRVLRVAVEDPAGLQHALQASLTPSGGAVAGPGHTAPAHAGGNPAQAPAGTAPGRGVAGRRRRRP
jgi:hypothetical protein